MSSVINVFFDTEKSKMSFRELQAECKRRKKLGTFHGPCGGAGVTREVLREALWGTPGAEPIEQLKREIAKGSTDLPPQVKRGVENDAATWGTWAYVDGVAESKQVRDFQTLVKSASILPIAATREASHHHVRYVTLYGKSSKGLSVTESVFLCAGDVVDPSTFASCKDVVYAFSRSAICEYMASNTQEHPASLDPALRNVKWASNKHAQRVKKLLRLQCKYAQFANDIHRQNLAETDGLFPILSQLLVNWLRNTSIGGSVSRLLNWVRDAYLYYTPQFVQSLNSKLYGFVTYATSWVWNHPFWVTFVATVSRCIRVLLCMFTERVPYTEKFAEAMFVELSKTLYLPVTIAKSVFKVFFHCGSSLLNFTQLAFLTGIRKFGSCVKDVLEGTGYIGDIVISFFQYVANRLAEDNGLATLYKTIAKSLDALNPRAQRIANIQLEDIINIVKEPMGFASTRVALLWMRSMSLDKMFGILQYFVGSDRQFQNMMVRWTGVKADGTAIIGIALDAMQQSIEFGNAVRIVLRAVDEMGSFVVCGAQRYLGYQVTCCEDLQSLMQMLIKQGKYEAAGEEYARDLQNYHDHTAGRDIESDGLGDADLNPSKPQPPLPPSKQIKIKGKDWSSWRFVDSRGNEDKDEL